MCIINKKKMSCQERDLFHEVYDAVYSDKNINSLHSTVQKRIGRPFKRELVIDYLKKHVATTIPLLEGNLWWTDVGPSVSSFVREKINEINRSVIQDMSLELKLQSDWVDYSRDQLLNFRQRPILDYPMMDTMTQKKYPMRIDDRFW